MEKTSIEGSLSGVIGFFSRIKTTGILFLFIILIGSAVILFSWSVNWESLVLIQSGMDNRPLPKNDLTLQTGHSRARLWFAKEAFLEGNYSGALKTIEPLLQRDDILALSLKGSVLSANGENSLAVTVFSEAGDVISLHNLAQRSTQLGDLYVAYLANKSICEIASDSSEECIKAGKYLIDQGRYLEADQFLKLAISRDPNRRSSYLTRANALRKNGDFSDAIEVYRLALQRFPDYDQIYFEISATYELDNQRPEAVKAIDLALRKVTNPSEKYLMLAGRIYERGGKPQEALAIYRKVLEINSENQVAQKAIRRLEKRE